MKTPKTQEKTQNSSEKVKHWEEFTPLERPRDVIKKFALLKIVLLVFKGSTGSSVGGDSLDGVDEGFVPVSIDVGAIRQVVAR